MTPRWCSQSVWPSDFALHLLLDLARLARAGTDYENIRIVFRVRRRLIS